MATDWMPLPSPMAENEHIFAFGDLHGQGPTYRKLIKTVSSIPKDPNKESILLSVGDITDRGFDTLDIYNHLFSNGAKDAGCDKLEFMPGNHEIALIAALRGDAQWQWEWYDIYSGHSVLVEFARMQGDLIPSTYNSQEFGVIKKLIAYIPELAKYLEENALTHKIMKQSHYRSGELLFVHAGVEPFRDPDKYVMLGWGTGPNGTHEYDEMVWSRIRTHFLEYRGKWEGETIVVHGHSPVLGDNQSPLYKAHKQPGVENGNYLNDENVHLLSMVDTHRRINLDVGCGKNLVRQSVVCEFKDNQYRFHVITP